MVTLSFDSRRGSAPRGVHRLPAIAPGSAAQRLLLGCGALGSVLFTTVYLIAGAIRPGYDAWRQPISALSLGPDGWVQVANFIVFGLLVGCFAAGLRATLAPGVGTIWAPLLQGLTALGLILAGIFVQDPGSGYPPGSPPTTPPTLHGILHLAATFLSLTARVLWCFVLARRFSRESHWRGWAIYSAATGILMVVFLNAFGQAIAHHGPAGAFERAIMVLTSLLTCALTARLLLRGGRLSPEGPDPAT